MWAVDTPLPDDLPAAAEITVPPTESLPEPATQPAGDYLLHVTLAQYFVHPTARDC